MAGAGQDISLGTVVASAVAWLGLTSCGIGTATVRQSEPIVYRYPHSNGAGVYYRDGRWWSRYQDKALTPQPDPDKDSHPLVNCSTPEYRCLRTAQFVFAVPVGPIVEGSHFSVAGADIQVAGCLAGPRDDCTTAIMVSDCRPSEGILGYADLNGINPRGCRQNASGELMEFTFSRDRGVIAYDRAPWREEGHEVDVSKYDLATLGRSAILLTLESARGLLAGQK